MAEIFDDPRFLPSQQFMRQVKNMEYTDKADLRRVALAVLVDSHCGTRRQDGSYEIPFGNYTLRYSLLSEVDPYPMIALNEVVVA